MGCGHGIGGVGLYYQKFPHEESLGPIFIRKTLDNYHICVQDPEKKHLYRIEADCQDPVLAEKIKDFLLEGK